MERSEVEAIANQVAERSAALHKSEAKVHMLELKQEFTKELRSLYDDIKATLDTMQSHPIAGMSHEDHAIEHQRMRTFLNSANDIKTEIIKKAIAYTFVGIISALVATYFGNPESMPAIIKEKSELSASRFLIEDLPA